MPSPLGRGVFGCRESWEILNLFALEPEPFTTALEDEDTVQGEDMEPTRRPPRRQDTLETAGLDEAPVSSPCRALATKLSRRWRRRPRGLSGAPADIQIATSLLIHLTLPLKKSQLPRDLHDRSSRLLHSLNNTFLPQVPHPLLLSRPNPSGMVQISLLSKRDLSPAHPS